MWAETTEGRSLHGWSLKAAKAEVCRRWEHRALLFAVCDETGNGLEQYAAAEMLLISYFPQNRKWNSETASKLLTAVLPPAAQKNNPGGKRVPVTRPPMSLVDVF